MLVDSENPDDSVEWIMLTVNLPASNELPENQQYLDINNFPSASKYVEEHGIAKPVGMKTRSGFVEYPLYEFDLDKIPFLY